MRSGIRHVAQESPAPLPFPPRHGRNYNILCCEGHVEGMSPSILFEPARTAARWNYDDQPHPEFWP